MFFEWVRRFWLSFRRERPREEDPAVLRIMAREERGRLLAMFKESTVTVMGTRNAQQERLRKTYAEGLVRALECGARNDEQRSRILCNCKALKLAELIFLQHANLVAESMREIIHAEEDALLFGHPPNEQERQEFDRLRRFDARNAAEEALAAAQRAVTGDDPYPLHDYLSRTGSGSVPDGVLEVLKADEAYWRSELGRIRAEAQDRATAVSQPGVPVGPVTGDTAIPIRGPTQVAQETSIAGSEPQDPAAARGARVPESAAGPPVSFPPRSSTEGPDVASARTPLRMDAGAMAGPPKVLISYSHDSPEHEERVLDLADRLRTDGVDAIIDLYEPHPPEGWPSWMERQVRDAAVVLLVCTETYARRVSGQEQPGVGRGVAWEANLIRNELYNAGAVSGKFVPVLFAAADVAFVPAPLQGQTHYRVDRDDGYEALYRRLTGQPLTPKPPLGARRSLPPRPRRSAGAVDAGSGQEPDGSGPPGLGAAEEAGGSTAAAPGTVPVDRAELYGLLRALPAGLLGQLIFTLHPPTGLVRGSAAPPAERVEDLVGWAQGPGGCGLEVLARELERVLGHPR